MLTQTQTIERQAALPAACPRPRALAFPACPVTTRPVPFGRVTTNPVTGNAPALSTPSVWSQSAPIFVAAFAQVPGFGAAGYAAIAPRPMGEVRTDAAGGREGYVGESTTSSKQQDQKHLTARRGPVTWRPPH